MTSRFVRISSLLIVAVTAIASASYSDSSLIEKRDAALKRIAECVKRDEASSRECKNMNKDIQMLVDICRQGDKSVLPTLLQFSYLRDFLGDALIGDSDGFLSAVARLPEQNQQAVAVGLAGGTFGLQRPRFEMIRKTLMSVPDASPNYQVARACLRALETVNASLIENYFPPQTFGDLTLRSLSRNLHALAEKPLWPPAGLNGERTYRITRLPAFSAADSVTLAVQADDSGRVTFHATDSVHENLDVDSVRRISQQQVSEFTVLLSQVQFWQLPAELPQKGMDGADWILEAVQNGKYHVVLRWCQSKTPFAEAGQKLFELAGHKHSGIC